MANAPDPYQSPADASEKLGTSGMAVASLICGIASFCLSFITAVPGLILGIISLSQISSSNGRLGGRGMAITGIICSVMGTVVIPIVGILIALLLPALQAAREAARRNTSAANMKNVALALHIHHDVHGTFPAAVDQSEGAPVSWRTKILPHLEQSSLYEQYDQSQAWDSAANQPATDMVIPVYVSPSYAGAEMNISSYLALSGEGTIFPPGKKMKFRDMADGTSTTLMFVEADDEYAVPWASPQDIDYDPANPMKGFGNHRPGIFMAAFGDGDVQTFSNDIDPDVLRAMISRAGDDPYAFPQ